MLSLLKSPITQSKTKLRKYLKKNVCQESISHVYQRLLDAENKNNQRKSILKIIDMCYNNLANQIQLSQELHLPFIPGPISIHVFPTILLEQNQVIVTREDDETQGEQTQLQFLFNYLKNVRQYYYCWIIYFNEELKILNVKLLKKEQMHDHEDLLNPILNLIGIFINRSIEKPARVQNHLQGNRNHVDQFYGNKVKRQVSDPKLHNKSISTINSSTGTTWKAIMKMHNLKEDSAETEKQFRNKLLSKYKTESKYQKYMKQSKKSVSIKPIKQKSKSQMLLNRSKSNNLKQIILQPLKQDQQPLNQKFKAFHSKTKLKKQSKTNKIASIYFKKTQIVQ